MLNDYRELPELLVRWWGGKLFRGIERKLSTGSEAKEVHGNWDSVDYCGGGGGDKYLIFYASSTYWLFAF